MVGRCMTIASSTMVETARLASLSSNSYAVTRRRRPEQRSAEGVGEQVRQVAGGARAPVHGDDAGPLCEPAKRGPPEAEASELLPHHPGDQARYHRGAQDVSAVVPTRRTRGPEHARSATHS